MDVLGQLGQVAGYVAQEQVGLGVNKPRYVSLLQIQRCVRMPRKLPEREKNLNIVKEQRSQPLPQKCIFLGQFQTSKGGLHFTVYDVFDPDDGSTCMYSFSSWK